MMKKVLIVLSLCACLLPAVVSAQSAAPQKYALVIGNGEYTNIGKLRNPQNDANDMAEALEWLGFTVEKVLDGSRVQMREAITRLKDRLSGSVNSYGFFFYAGHGVQASGENYLIPVNADIQSENEMPELTVSLQVMLRDLSAAGNVLNMIVLDACRNNPFSWAAPSSREVSGTRGLSMVNNPVGSMIMYATAADAVASDGEGKNGLFTGHLLDNLKKRELTVQEVFTQTADDVVTVTSGNQYPELSLKYFRAVYLDPVSGSGVGSGRGKITILSEIDGMILLDGRPTGNRVKAGGSITIDDIQAGVIQVAVQATNGTMTTKVVVVREEQTANVDIRRPWEPPPPEGGQTVRDRSQLVTLGASGGTAFADPLFVGTIHGTFVPLKEWPNWFVEAGLDLGLGSAYSDVESYFSMYPFAHAGYFRPAWEKGGWFAGAGFGFMFGNYTFSEGDVPVNVFAVDMTAGVILLDMINISYTLRTNFGSASNKISVGYVKRF